MSEELRWVKTHGARMDHGGCGLRVGVRGNEIVRIEGDPDGYLNRGYACFKGRVSAERLTHPDRLKQPLKRAGGRGRKEMAGHFRRSKPSRDGREPAAHPGGHGARAVGFGVGMPKGLEHFVLIRLANSGSPTSSPPGCLPRPWEITGVHTCGFYLWRPPSSNAGALGNNLPPPREGQIAVQLRSG